MPTTAFFIGVSVMPDKLYGYVIYFTNGPSPAQGTVNATSIQ
jgi:hypothetical protein